MLACPKSKLPLEEAPGEILERINKTISAGKAKTISGEEVTRPLAKAFWEKENRLLYPIRNGIPVLIYEKSIPVSKK